MTAPIWLAFPPEVHSTLLSSGPGPGPLLAAAGAWSALSTEYTEAADELTAVLASVQAGDWQGPTAAQYVAAHAPYLSWLLTSAANSTTAAAMHETAAGAYTAALAAMPTLGELAANHAIHGALVATNFFGINTIPIALNEADYARMWVQAATTMSAYEAVSETALAAVPPSTPAPPIMTAAANTSTVEQASTAAPQYPSWMDQLAQWLQQYTSGFAWPVSKWLNPGGWPFPPVPWVNSLAAFFGQLGLSPALASAMGWAIFHTLMIFWPFLQIAIQLAVVAVPAMMIVAATGAAGAAAGATAIAVGTAVPLAVQPAPAVPAPTPMPSAPAPAGFGNVPTTSSVSAPAPAPASATAAPASGAPPAGGGPAVGFGPTSTTGLGAGLSDALYAVGLSGLSGRAAASSRSRRKSAQPAADDVDAPADAAAAPAKQRLKARRRRGATVKDKAYRYEYMDLEDAAGPDDVPDVSVGESGQSAGLFGFAGAATKSGARQAAGLATLDDDGLSDGPAVPMLPNSWTRG
ncbi:PPE family protein [Mycobacterium sherrisii]|uniref:PPE family protein n=1 Tax=Mycobacterium sherrisii TaxID=243061 RepID=UPI0039771674